jgi:acyl-lipid Delta6-acetylenase / acyl-lipid (9-3)-desaturase
MQISHTFSGDHAAGSALASLMGISTTWWKRSHNTHHVACNSVENDPDIQTMPLIAVSSSLFAQPFYSSYYRKNVVMDDACRALVTRQVKCAL